jgi:hypothetical protein
LNQLLLKKLGLNEKQDAFILEKFPHLMKRFKKHHSYFEKTKSHRGVYEIQDGITCDAVFCMKDLHRELPKRLINQDQILGPEEFISIFKSSYAKKEDLLINGYRRNEVERFQHFYLKIMKKVANQFHGGNLEKTLLEVIMRASVANQENRITGDSILHVASSLIRNQKNLTFDQKRKIIDCLVQNQVEQSQPKVKPDSKTGKIVLRNLKAIRYYRDGF